MRTVFSRSIIIAIVTVLMFILMNQNHLRLIFTLMNWDGDLHFHTNDQFQLYIYEFISNAKQKFQVATFFTLSPSIVPWIINDIPFNFQNNQLLTGKYDEPVIWRIERETMQISDPVFYSDAPFSLTKERRFSMGEILSMIGPSTTDRTSAYVSNVHIINVIPSTVTINRTSSYTSSPVSVQLSTVLERNLFANSRKLGIKVKRYDWMIPLNESINDDSELLHMENVLTDIKSVFRSDSMFIRHDIYIAVFPSSFTTTGIQILTSKGEKVGGIIDGEKKDYLIIVGKNISGKDNAALDVLSRHIIRKHIFTYDSSILLNLFNVQSKNEENSISKLERYLSTLNVTPMELYIEFMVRQYRDQQRLKAQLAHFKQDILRNVWKIISCSSLDSGIIEKFVRETAVKPNPPLSLHLDTSRHYNENELLSYILRSIYIPYNNSSKSDFDSKRDWKSLFTLVAEQRGKIFIAQPTLSMVPQVLFIIYGPFWFPLLVPIYRILNHLFA